MARKKRATLNISQEVKSELDTVKSPGQSYDGIIRALVKFWREKNKEYWTRRRAQRASE